MSLKLRDYLSYALSHKLSELIRFKLRKKKK